MKNQDKHIIKTIVRSSLLLVLYISSVSVQTIHHYSHHSDGHTTLSSTHKHKIASQEEINSHCVSCDLISVNTLSWSAISTVEINNIVIATSPIYVLSRSMNIRLDTLTLSLRGPPVA